MKNKEYIEQLLNENDELEATIQQQCDEIQKLEEEVERLKFLATNLALKLKQKHNESK